MQDFKAYRDATGKIEIIQQKPYKNDPYGRHYSIVYPNQEKGLSWRLRFSNRGFCTNDEFTPCSIKVIINPKILSGERNYIVAANASYLDTITQIFEQEAMLISPFLRTLHLYSMNRIDYCINFDVSELEFDCPPELKRKLPWMIMELVKHGDVPNKFSAPVEYNGKFQFYLKSQSVTINCYWKHDDLRRNFYHCPDLESSFNIIRFEVQYRYPKTITTASQIKKQHAIRRSIAEDELERQRVLNPAQKGNCTDAGDVVYSLKKYRELQEKHKSLSKSDETVVMEQMLSDERCSTAINHYFYKIIKPGNYYKFDVAKRIVESKVPKWEKTVRLINTLNQVRDCGGIANAKSILQGKDLEDFRRSLRELSRLKINPVTIPTEWNIEYIPNLLDNYYIRLTKERERKKDDELLDTILKEYLEDCRKRGVPFGE